MVMFENRIQNSRPLTLNHGLAGAEIGDCATHKSQKKTVDGISEAMHSAVSLAERVEAIVNDIVGTVPRTPSVCGTAGGPIDGVLPGLFEQALRTDKAIRDAHAALDRLREGI